MHTLSSEDVTILLVQHACAVDSGWNRYVKARANNLMIVWSHYCQSSLIRTIIASKNTYCLALHNTCSQIKYACGPVVS